MLLPNLDFGNPDFKTHLGDATVAAQKWRETLNVGEKQTQSAQLVEKTLAAFTAYSYNRDARLRWSAMADKALARGWHEPAQVAIKAAEESGSSAVKSLGEALANLKALDQALAAGK